MSVDTLPEAAPSTTTDDPDAVAHLVYKADHARGYIEGAEIVAVCGHRWIPSRDPVGLPVCEPCKVIWNGYGGNAEEVGL